MHRAFKDHVALARPALQDTIEEIGSGEYWMAVQAKKLGLVDEIMTSDEYLESICREMEIIEILEKKQWNKLLYPAPMKRMRMDAVLYEDALGNFIILMILYTMTK